MGRRMVRLVAAAFCLAALVAAALLVLGARDGGEPVARAADGRVVLALDDFRFVPQRVRASRGRVTFVLHNRGRLSHGFRVRKDGREWIRQPSLPPGGTATVGGRLERGDYRMFDPLSNYEELGMYGTLLVR
jgi:hypothetical protein